MALFRRSALLGLALALSVASLPALAAKQAKSVEHATSASAWIYERDPNGNITKATAPNGRVSTTTYDALNRPITTTYVDAGPGEVSSRTLHHDGNGNITAIDEVRNGVTRTETRRYDVFDRLEHVTDVHGRTLDYGYDLVGNRTRMVDNDGKETVWTYDGLNRNTTITVPGQGTTTQTFYRSGRPDTITHPDGTTSKTTYDDAGRLASLVHTKAGQTVASYVYRYDANGNRIEQKEINGSAEQLTTYRYDESDRLTQVIEPTRTTVYTLDPVGNRAEELVTDTTGAVISHSTLMYNERDQLTGRDDPATGTHVEQTYDPNGNLKTQQIAGVFRTYTYDGQDRLVELDLPGQPPLRFDYDARGQRIEKSQSGQATRYQYDGQSLTAETNVIGNTLKRYHYSATQLLGETLAGSTPVNRHFLLDALKTPIAVITQLGGISARTRYDAWGRILSQTDANGNTTTPNRDAPIAVLPSTDAQPFGFTGYVKDGESGLYYANARYYDPATARFTTEDPEAGQDMTPPSLHRYLYAYANPSVYTDRTGRQAYDDDVEKAAMSLGWNDAQYHDALKVQAAAREETSGTYYGAGKLTAKALWATVKYGAKLTGKMLFDIGDAKDIIEPPLSAVTTTADAIRAGPEALTEYYADKSLKAEALRREGKYFEAGELYGPEFAAVASTVLPFLRKGGKASVPGATAGAEVATIVEGAERALVSPRELRAELKNNSGPIDDGAHGGRNSAEGQVDWKDEGGDLRAGASPGMRPDAYEFQSGASGARSNAISGRGQAPYLEFTNAEGQIIGAKFDGVQGSELIDRKLSPVFSPKAVDQAQRQAAVAQHYGLVAVWEMKTTEAVEAANRFMKANQINGISVRLGGQK